MRGRPIHPNPPYLLTIAVTLVILGLLALAVMLSTGS